MSLLLPVSNKVWLNHTIPTILLIFPSCIFPNTIYPLIFILTKASDAHSCVARSRWAAVEPFVIQPIPYSSSLHSSISIAVSDLSRLCEGEGFRVGDGCLKSEENETRRYKYKHMHAYMHTFTNKHRRILREAGVWWTALAFGRTHDKAAERSGRGKASSTLDREMKRGERNKRGECERSVPPGLWPSVCLCGYLPLHCLLAENEAMCWEAVKGCGVGISESMTVNKQREGGGERVRRDAWKCYL